MPNVNGKKYSYTPAGMAAAPKKQLRRKKPRESKMGLYSNINAKKKRIAAGSGET
jgi:hypothetical protein